MHPRTVAAPPWERRNVHRRHPVGRARRRWPRAYDGSATEAMVKERYRDSYEEERRRERRRSSRRRTPLDALRQNPIRNGLIGLAVAGTAAPIAVNHYQQAMRTDPTHERLFSAAPLVVNQATDGSVTEAWSGMETARSTAASARESVIQQKLEQYSAYNLSHELAEQIYDMSQSANIDPDVAFGLVRTESAFKNSATSHVGALGLTQLMPSSARWLEPGTTKSDLRNPETNLRIGFNYLRQLIDRYHGDTRMALLAYNRGPGTVDRVLKKGGNPDNGYASMVLDR